MEHNTGGALGEFGRADRPFLFERAYVFPRGYEPHYDDARDSLEEIHGRSIEIAYQAGDREAMLDDLEEVVEQAATSGVPVTVDGLTVYLEEELGGRLPPSYSGVITDGIKHYEQVDRCFAWTTKDELRNRINELP